MTTKKTTAMTPAATTDMQREIDWFRSEFGIDDERIVADMQAMFRSAYEWGRMAAQAEAFAAQIDAHFAAMAIR